MKFRNEKKSTYKLFGYCCICDSEQEFIISSKISNSIRETYKNWKNCEIKALPKCKRCNCSSGASGIDYFELKEILKQ